jgi:hypothetical protein
VVTVLERYGHLLPGSEERVTDALEAMAQAASALPGASVVTLGSPPRLILTCHDRVTPKLPGRVLAAEHPT